MVRKGIAAVAVAGSIFGLTAAGASTLTVTSGPVPAAGSATGTNCTASASIGYTATSTFPAEVFSVDITPNVVGTGCDSLPALIEVSYGSTTLYAYRSGGLLTSNFSLLASNFCSTADAAVLGENCTAPTSLGAVADFTSPTTSITIANDFKTD